MVVQQYYWDWSSNHLVFLIVKRGRDKLTTSHGLHSPKQMSTFDHIVHHSISIFIAGVPTCFIAFMPNTSTLLHPKKCIGSFQNWAFWVQMATSWGRGSAFHNLLKFDWCSTLLAGTGCVPMWFLMRQGPRGVHRCWWSLCTKSWLISRFWLRCVMLLGVVRLTGGLSDRTSRWLDK